MSEQTISEDENQAEEQSPAEELIPKKPSRLCPRGIQTFTVARQADETGVSGEGVVIEGATFATGHPVIHWLTPAHAEVLRSLTHLMISSKFT